MSEKKEQFTITVTGILGSPDVFVRGPMQHKAICITALATAIQVIANHKPTALQTNGIVPAVVEPTGSGN